MAENAAESRRQFNNVPIGFKGFRETHTGTVIFFKTETMCSRGYLLGHLKESFFFLCISVLSPCTSACQCVTLLLILSLFFTRCNLSSSHSDDEDPSATAQAQLRKSVLNSLVEAPKPSEDIPPARLPTKEEKELIKLSLSLENLKMQSQMQQGFGESMMESTFNNNLTNTSSYLSAPSKVLAPLRSPGGVGGLGGIGKGSVSAGPSLKRGGLSPPRSRGGEYFYYQFWKSGKVLWCDFLMFSWVTGWFKKIQATFVYVVFSLQPNQPHLSTFQLSPVFFHHLPPSTFFLLLYQARVPPGVARSPLHRL